MCEQPIKVAVRMRPSLEEEVIVGPEALRVCSKENKIFYKDSFGGHMQEQIYDFVYDENSHNINIYNELVKPNIKNLLDGYNVTILAYGSTGSGKTHTMGSTPENFKSEDKGLIPLGLQDIFEALEPLASQKEVILSASFFEIYLEEIKDLLNPSNSSANLMIRGDGSDIKILNLTEIVIKSIEEAINLLDIGSRARHTDTTAKNRMSSRSHAIFAVNLTLIDKTSKHSTKSKFQLVDLAGSERTKISKTEGQQFKQGLAINKALSTLGRVINSLFSKERHIPYRDSSLTRILQESFGGNSHTIMMSCISPSVSSFEETLSTLRYAANARSIKNTPRINKDPKEALIESLRIELKTCKLQLEIYKSAKQFGDVHPPAKTKTITYPGGVQEVIDIGDDNDEDDDEETLKFQEETFKEIHNINMKLNLKEQDLSECQFLSKVLDVPHDSENINEHLLKTIKKLEEEKKVLMKKTSSQEAQKVSQNIEVLEKQLKRKQNLKNLKLTNSQKEDLLKNEIKNLKTSKVELLKKHKDEIRVEKQKLKDEKKKTALLEKDARNKEAKFKKTEETLGKKLKILEKKINDAKDSQQKIHLPLKCKSSTKKTISKDFENKVENLIKQEIENAKLEAEILFYEEEAKTLNVESGGERSTIVSDDVNQKIEEIKKVLKENLIGEVALDFVKDEDEFKEVISSLIKMMKLCEKERHTKTLQLEKANATIEGCSETLSKLEIENLQLSKSIKDKESKKARKKETESKLTELEDYLDDPDESFASTGDLSDPDFRATPLHKRKIKRKSPEIAPVEEVTPAKRLITHGCQCPSNCTTMRCSCRKKSHICSQFCECDKNICKNVASTSKN